DNNGNGNGHDAPAGRGVTRGKREVSQIVWTKPQAVSNKAGLCGSAIRLIANYFGLQKTQNWMLCLYHVDFSPQEDETREKKRLMRQHNEFLGSGYLFDGMQLYLSRKLPNEVTELCSKKENGDVFQVKLKYIKALEGLDIQFMHILNILMKRCQDHLGLQLMGRNYYNPKAETREPNYQITIWPGVSTSIRQFEKSIMLNVDVTHKFLREENVLSAMSKQRNPKAWDTLLGTVVMTKYNEKTYRIDDVHHNCSPRSTFEYKGKQMTYIDYYWQKYEIRIRDPNQPMLMSKPKKRDIRRGMATNISLVPELCTMTGLSDEMRNDFNVMKGLAQYMRMTP
ncbi:UNVERIFIED_CONTAM: hypothetical protein GTU68_053210, partial [Idotea baltica]|nr:hypothetical protein [Idotea baltica]